MIAKAVSTGAIAGRPTRREQGEEDERGKEEPGATGLLSIYWQLEAIIRTDSTLSFGAFTLELDEALVLELVELLADEPP